jgi:hypothetical protein
MPAARGSRARHALFALLAALVAVTCATVRARATAAQQRRGAESTWRSIGQQ